ncbi:MAG TPA: hypothetical protein VED18_06805, partial [Candidatus Sulfotelmatobacter sp.]|nr:hypothetical protein [Candidatus Sulfotelmatobacter sp.]
ITAAPLTPSALPAAKACLGIDCRLCLDECPGRAFSLLPGSCHDRLWLDPVSRTDWAACRRGQLASPCMGLCLQVCPVRRNGSLTDG